ncbi:LBP_cg2779 family protein [Ligilactobacillus sp. WILCCON 0076]|uniref:LBP_cg2779 family protein n=1 Tax=Ligilactobacillus ubinensis TaxID=2876789 RepID=A0A9X2FKE0_9LACO|nr:LBP_cg2779 family protein [Ligilactobacillus ubinensis]MCP0887299.1 LBP_cg2779 family protein [Ligilactobacillus ubinensis]
MKEISQLNELAQKIVEFEKEHRLNDTDFALLSRLSVEKVHALKAMYATPTEEEIEMLNETFNAENQSSLEE